MADYREPKWAKEREEWGFDERETWGLDSTIANHWSYPGNLTKEKWAKILDDMIYAMEICSEDNVLNEEPNWKKVNRGLISFGKYFRSLWW